MSESSRKSKKQPEPESLPKIKRTTVAFNEEVVALIDEFALQERTDRSNIINSLLWVILKSPGLLDRILARKTEETAYEITLAQIIQEALIFYFEYAHDPKIKEQALATHRSSRKMLEYLVELGWEKYLEDRLH